MGGIKCARAGCGVWGFAPCCSTKTSAGASLVRSSSNERSEFLDGSERSPWSLRFAARGAVNGQTADNTSEASSFKQRISGKIFWGVS